MKYITRLTDSNSMVNILNEMTTAGYKFVQAVTTGSSNSRYSVTLIFTFKDK